MRTLRAYLAILVLGAMLPGTLLTTMLVWRAFANPRAVSERRLLESARVDAAALDHSVCLNPAGEVIGPLRRRRRSTAPTL